MNYVNTYFQIFCSESLHPTLYGSLLGGSTKIEAVPSLALLNDELAFLNR